MSEGQSGVESDKVPMIDAVFVALSCRALQARGIDPAAALAEAGIDDQLLDDRDARLPFRQSVEMLEVSARHAGDSCFGLHLGAGMVSEDVGVLGYLALSSATVAEAIVHVLRYYLVLTSAETFISREEDGRLIVEYRVLDPAAQHLRQNDDISLMSTLRFMQIATGTQVAPERVEFRHSEPEDPGEYRRLFGAPVEFGAAINALVFPASVLQLPIRSADKNLLHILKGYCETVIEARGGADDFMRQVEEMAMRLLPEGPPKAAAVARSLGMSTRTLSRRLQEHGVTYRDLVDELRAGLSQQYLRDRKLRISEVAYLLGYSNLSGFNHAFNRWTGRSPTDFRRSEF